MSKCYEDLSRRGLIKLNHDFDQEFDGALHQYLAENGDKYEDIRPIESIIDRVDQICETSSGCKMKMKALFDKDNGETILDTVINTVSEMAKDITIGDIVDVANSIIG